MKRSLLFLFLLLSVGVNAQNKPITLRLNNASVESVLQRLRTEFSYKLLFNHEEVKSAGNVNVELTNASIDAALGQILRGTDLSFSQQDGVYVIAKKRAAAPIAKRVLRGFVYGPDGKPLSGAAVTLAATSKLGTITDGVGKFVINVPEGVTSFTVSYVGMTSFTGRIGNEATNNVTVRLEEMAQTMDDVVVTGYQTIDRRMQSSSTSTLKGEELDLKGALTVDQMLEGKLPGLMVVSSSSTPGAASKMRLRGTSTFTGNREPLWVIDNIIYENPVPLTADDINSWDNINIIGNAISGLNPNDIERIDVLKDAAATAIYGTRASNGVIVVTTKQGKEGESTVNYTGNFKISRPPHYGDFDLMDSKERIDVSREIVNRGLWYPNLPPRVGYEGAIMDYWDKKITFDEFESRVHTMETNNTDWFDALFRPAFSQSHNVSLSGGANKTRYYFSVGYADENGAEKNVDLNRITGRVNLTSSLSKKVTLGVKMSGSVQNGNYAYGYSPFSSAYYTSRTIPIYNPDGSYYYLPRHAYDNNYVGYNLLNELERSGQEVVNKSFNLTGNLNWEIVKGLKYIGTASYTSSTNIQESWVADKTYAVDILRVQRAPYIDEGGLYSSGFTDQMSWTIRNQINFNKVWNGMHTLNVDMGQEARSTGYKGTTGGSFPGYQHDRGQKFTYIEALSATNMDWDAAINRWFAGTNPLAYPKITNQERNNISFYGTFTYAYKSVASINFNLRNDGSNQFGQYKRARFNPTWSVSGRVNLTELGMLGGKNGNSFAFRASYGYRGNVPNASPYLLIGMPTPNSVMSEETSYVNSFPNGNLGWEKTSTINAAVDYSYLNNRITGALDAYYSYSSDLLTSRTISLVNGESHRLVNSGSATNWGIEFSIRTINIKNKNFRWNTSFSISTNKNTIKQGEQSNTKSTYDKYLQGNVIRAGQNVDGFYSYKFAGLDERGLPRFKDLYGNKPNLTRDEIFETIFKYEGSRTPLLHGGFSTEFDYKGVRLRANLTYKLGHKVRLLRLYENGTALPMPDYNTQGIFTQRWRKPGDEKRTNIPGLSNEALGTPQPTDVVLPADEWKWTMVDSGFYSLVGPTSNTAWYMYDFSDVRVANADFIRIRDISIGYALPGKWLESLGIKNARVDFQVQNVGVIVFDSKLKGQDPEQVFRVGMPALPTYTLNLSLDF